MDSFCGIHCRQSPKTLHLSLSRPPPFSRKPSISPISLKPFSKKPYRRPQISLRASLNPPFSARKPPNGEARYINLETLASFLKPTCAALTAAAALFFFSSGLQKPSLASTVSAPPRPPAQSDSSSLKEGSLKQGSEPGTEEEKEKVLEEYLDEHPDDVRALRALMEVKIKAQNIPEAVGIVDRLILLEPNEKDLPLLKAHLQSYGGGTQVAKQGFEEILEKDPLLVEAYHGLVMVASEEESVGPELDGILKRIQTAMERCKKEKRKEDLRDFKLLVAQVKVIQGKYDEALKFYQELVKEEPRDFRPYLCQGIVYTLLRRKDEAEKQFEKYRRLVPKGHPYAQFFDESMIATKVFSQVDENKRASTLKS